MKKIGFFTLALVFLASGLVFLGCDSELPGNGGDNGGQAPGPNTLTLWGTDSQNRDVRIRIVSPPGSSAGPLSGDSFDITVFGQGDAEDQTFSGTVAVSGTDPVAVTFNQTYPTAGSTLNGSFVRETGVMTTTGVIPGTTISGITVETAAGGGNGGGGGGATGGGGDTPVIRNLASLPYVIAVAFDLGDTANNRLAATHPGVIREGFPVAITSPRIRVTFRDGNNEFIEYRTSMANFIINPPIHTAQSPFEEDDDGNSVFYTVTYIGSAGENGFVRSNNSISTANHAAANTQFRRLVRDVDSHWQPGGPFFGWHGTNLTLPIEAHTARLNIREDDTYFTPIAGRHLRARFTEGGPGIQLTLNSNHPMRVVGNNIEVRVGSQTVDIPLTGGYSVFRILTINYTPTGEPFIIYDDSRFTAGPSMHGHWLNLFRTGNVTVTYRNTEGSTLTRTTTIPALFRQAETVRAREPAFFGGGVPGATNPLLDFYRPTNLNVTNPRVTLRYEGIIPADSATQQLNVPVFNNLVSINVVSTLVPPAIVMTHPNAEPQFLNKVRIEAVYRLGNDRNNLVRRTDVKRDIADGITDLMSNDIVTNVRIGGTGILNARNAESFTRNQRPIRATVTLSPSGGGQNTSDVRGTIDIGVEGAYP